MGFLYTDNYPTTRIPLFVHPFVGSSLANVLYPIALLPMYFGPFTQCKTYSSELPRKMASNKKVQENKLALKINLTKE